MNRIHAPASANSRQQDVKALSVWQRRNMIAADRGRQCRNRPLIAVSIQRVEQGFYACGSDSLSSSLSSLSEPAEAAFELARVGEPRASRKDDRGFPLSVDSGPNQPLSPMMCHPEVRAPRSYQELQYSFARGAEGSALLFLRITTRTESRFKVLTAIANDRGFYVKARFITRQKRPPITGQSWRNNP